MMPRGTIGSKSPAKWRLRTSPRPKDVLATGCAPGAPERLVFGSKDRIGIEVQIPVARQLRSLDGTLSLDPIDFRFIDIGLRIERIECAIQRRQLLALWGIAKPERHEVLSRPRGRGQRHQTHHRCPSADLPHLPSQSPKGAAQSILPHW